MDNPTTIISQNIINVDIDSRAVTLPVNFNLGVMYDNSCKTITFMVQKKSDITDLTDLTFSVNTISAKGTPDKIECDSREEGGFYIITAVLKGTIFEASGKAVFNLCGQKFDSSHVAIKSWGSEDITALVGSHSHADKAIEERYPSVLEDLKSKIENLNITDAQLDNIATKVAEKGFYTKTEIDSMIANKDTFEAYDRFYESIANMRVNPTEPLNIQTYDGSNNPTHPKVLYFPNGWSGHKYWLTYSPFPSNNNTYENPCIEYSEDGVNFSSDGITNPIEDTPMENSTKVGYNSDPHLVLVNNVMECWWRTHYQSGINANHEVIYRKTSKDGITWSEKEELFRVEDASAGSCLSPTVIYEDGIYKIWCVYKQQVLKYYESEDGTNWTYIRDINVDNVEYPTYKIWHFDIIHTVKGYEFVGCYHPTSNYDDNKYIYYAISSDNITYSQRKLILTNGPTGNFDATELYRPCIVREENVVKIYYGCRNGYGNWKIGMIEAPNPYLFNAILENQNRFDSILTRLTNLENGSGSSGGTEDTTAVSSFEESSWLEGYYNDSGTLTSELNMHHTQLIEMPNDNLLYTFTTNGISYPRIVYFDSTKQYIGYDRGNGFNISSASTTVTEIILNTNVGATYFSLCANTKTKNDVSFTGTTNPTIVDESKLIASYVGNNHGTTDGEWTETNGGTSIALNGCTWEGDILTTDGVDDYLNLSLENAKTVKMRIKLFDEYVGTSGNVGYVFDCRSTVSAYLLNYEKADYVGSDATVYHDLTKFKPNTNNYFPSNIKVDTWYDFTIIFNTPFTGNMKICCNQNTSDFMEANIEYIKVYSE